MTNTEIILEIDTIKEEIAKFAFTNSAKQEARELSPFLSERQVRAALKETTEAKNLIEKLGNPPLTAFEEIGEYIQIIDQGGCLTPEQLEKIATNLVTVKRLKDYLENGKQHNISVSYYEENLQSCDEVKDEILRVIRNGRVDDYATKKLKRLREEIQILNDKMHQKAEQILKNNRNCMSDNFVVTRNGRICVPVKKDYKFKIQGSVIEKSSTGNTLFVEPLGVSKYAEEIILKLLEEEDEERNILYTLTAMIGELEDVFEKNKNTIERLDFMFAKAKYSIEINGICPKVNVKRTIEIKNAKHPLMDMEKCVPLNFSLGNETQGVIITGPNTGGKTVAIKTVGVVCFMAQSGLHVSCEAADICMNNLILCDIGDGQNIAENLSTFSAHITNVLEILQMACKESLVIMDELGSGTDPTEGMGIAIAILEQLKKSEALFLVTTHYPEVKEYGEQTEGIVNARMKFDRDTLRPLYQLEIGKSGNSCALYIAQKLGMPAKMIERAWKAAYETEMDVNLKPITNKNLELMQKPAAKIQKQKQNAVQNNKSLNFNIGDSVIVYPENKIGIVCKKADEKGNLQIQMPEKKIYINHKRIKLHVAADKLYPENYDFSIIFDTVENRKARHKMGKRHMEDLEIHIDE